MSYRTKEQNDKIKGQKTNAVSTHAREVGASGRVSVLNLSGMSLDRAIHDAVQDQQMVTIKTRSLEGASLNAVVALCLGHKLVPFDDMFRANGEKAGKDPAHIDRLLSYQSLSGKLILFKDGVAGASSVPDYEADYALAGPLLDEERISTVIKHDGWWCGLQYDINNDEQHVSLGQTRLQAGLRCFVESKVGPSFQMRADHAKCLGLEVKPSKDLAP